MSDAVISAEGLGKKYLISHQTGGGSKENFREAIRRSLHNFGRTLGDAVRGRQLLLGDQVEEFWALQDLDFSIDRGEVVGVIGRNGAGKSTLLKLLSRITEPSTGQVTIKGRVASLLEVGTGFHPELTGRENIYLNGAILGMSRAEVKRKFDEIVAFAEVEKFLDTPVKRYSSGMYVRLAFSVAAHLEPEILVVDEVLAVGDAEFQRKCMGKMDDVAQGGRTVLFVSHNMTTIERLCPRAILLKNGRIAYQGDTDKAIALYSEGNVGRTDLGDPSRRKGNGYARFEDVQVDGTFSAGNVSLKLDCLVAINQPVKTLEVRATIYGSNEVAVSAFGSNYSGESYRDLDAGDYKFRLTVPDLPLNAGHYRVHVSLSDPIAGYEIMDMIDDALFFSVSTGDPFGTGRLPTIGSVVIPHHWEKLRDKQI